MEVSENSFVNQNHSSLDQATEHSNERVKKEEILLIVFFSLTGVRF